MIVADLSTFGFATAASVFFLVSGGFSWQQARQADDHPPVEPSVSPGGRGGRDQEGRDIVWSAHNRFADVNFLRPRLIVGDPPRRSPLFSRALLSGRQAGLCRSRR